VPGARASRPELDQLLSRLRASDKVTIYKLDRLGRSLKHLLQVVGDLQQQGVGLVSLTDAVNTTSAQGRLVFHLFASLAEFERELIRERTRPRARPAPGAGWAAAGGASRRKQSARPS
jgi:DNA invertase Pin-like site-specific DNA recombinase